jgi:TetR/AcrR family acrAB operon transcriptional repressor
LVRRTKEEALATRHRLLDAAELLFLAKGVSHTSLQDIAREAEADLFNAMMDRVTLPFEASLAFLAHDAPVKPLAHICSTIRHSLVRIASRTGFSTKTPSIWLLWRSKSCGSIWPVWA